MGDSLASWSAENCGATYAGVPLDGFADGTFITIKRLSDTWSDKAGSQGEVVRSKNPDKRCEIQIHFQKTSFANTILSSYALADENDDAVYGGAQPLVVYDNNSGATFVAHQAWLVKAADDDKAREAADTVWTFHCSSGDVTPSGNVGPSVVGLPPVVSAELPEVAQAIAASLTG